MEVVRRKAREALDVAAVDSESAAVILERSFRVLQHVVESRRADEKMRRRGVRFGGFVQEVDESQGLIELHHDFAELKNGGDARIVLEGGAELLLRVPVQRQVVVALAKTRLPPPVFELG